VAGNREEGLTCVAVAVAVCSCCLLPRWRALLRPSEEGELRWKNRLREREESYGRREREGTGIAAGGGRERGLGRAACEGERLAAEF
jgi:hypothetical protein